MNPVLKDGDMMVLSFDNEELSMDQVKDIYETLSCYMPKVNFLFLPKGIHLEGVLDTQNCHIKQNNEDVAIWN